MNLNESLKSHEVEHSLQQLYKNQGQKLPNIIQPLSFSPPKIICGNSLPSLFQVVLGELLEMRLKEVEGSFYIVSSSPRLCCVTWGGRGSPHPSPPNPSVSFCCELQLDFHFQKCPEVTD